MVSDLATAFGVWRMFVAATMIMGSIVVDEVDVVVDWRRRLRSVCRVGGLEVKQ